MSDCLDATEFKTGEELTEDHLGQGGFGDVYRCYRFQSDGDVRKVAIKFIRIQNKKQEKEAQQEVRMLRNVKGFANVTQSLGYIEHEKWMGIVLEYAERGSLYEVRRKVNLPWKLRVRIMQEAASGMAQLHSLSDELRITHNDLKPQNILIDRDFHAKIGDLGASNIDKHSDRPSFDPEDDRYTVCTLIYTAPEYFYIKKEMITRKAMTRRKSMDVYSYAMVIYFVLTGKQPFEGYKKPDFQSALLNGRHPSYNPEKLKERLTKEESLDFDMLAGIMEESCVYDALGSPTRATVSAESANDNTLHSTGSDKKRGEAEGGSTRATVSTEPGPTSTNKERGESQIAILVQGVVASHDSGISIGSYTKRGEAHGGPTLATVSAESGSTGSDKERGDDDALSKSAAERRPTMKDTEGKLLKYLEQGGQSMESAVETAMTEHSCGDRPVPKKLVTFEDRCQQLNELM